jgi:hypothetical protein
MRRRHRNTIIFIAACALFHWATAQNDPKNAPAACPEAKAILGTDLYGVWDVELTFVDEAAVPSPSSQQRGMVRFEQNPEFEDSIAGWFELGNTTVYVAGDIDEGQFSLEESDDGKRISAVWEGSIAEGSCGKTITGTRRVGEQVGSFVLSKPSGWR